VKDYKEMPAERKTDKAHWWKKKKSKFSSIIKQSRIGVETHGLGGRD